MSLRYFSYKSWILVKLRWWIRIDEYLKDQTRVRIFIPLVGSPWKPTGESNGDVVSISRKEIGKLLPPPGNGRREFSTAATETRVQESRAIKCKFYSAQFG